MKSWKNQSIVILSHSDVLLQIVDISIPRFQIECCNGCVGIGIVRSVKVLWMDIKSASLPMVPLVAEKLIQLKVTFMEARLYVFLEWNNLQLEWNNLLKMPHFCKLFQIWLILLCLFARYSRSFSYRASYSRFDSFF